MGFSGGVGVSKVNTNLLLTALCEAGQALADELRLHPDDDAVSIRCRPGGCLYDDYDEDDGACLSCTRQIRVLVKRWDEAVIQLSTSEVMIPKRLSNEH